MPVAATVANWLGHELHTTLPGPRVVGFWGGQFGSLLFILFIPLWPSILSAQSVGVQDVCHAMPPPQIVGSLGGQFESPLFSMGPLVVVAHQK